MVIQEGIFSSVLPLFVTSWIQGHDASTFLLLLHLAGRSDFSVTFSCGPRETRPLHLLLHTLRMDGEHAIVFPQPSSMSLESLVQIDVSTWDLFLIFWRTGAGLLHTRTIRSMIFLFVSVNKSILIILNKHLFTTIERCSLACLETSLVCALPPLRGRLALFVALPSLESELSPFRPPPRSRTKNQDSIIPHPMQELS